MNRFFLCNVVITSLILSSCSSSPKSAAEKEPDKIISRTDDLSARPDWLKESEPFTIDDGKVYSLGSTTISADQRVEAAYRVAENNAKAGISGAIEQRLEFIFQYAEEGADLGADQARYIGAEASKLVTSSIRVAHRYWEKVATTQNSGDRISNYRVFVSVSMPEADFKRAIMKAASKAEGKVGLSHNFSEKVDKHWDQFTAPIPEEKPEVEVKSTPVPRVE